jgi:hypothetical protein
VDRWLALNLSIALTHFIFRYGIEGIVYTSGDQVSSKNNIVYDQHTNTLTAGDAQIKIFGEVKVRIQIEGDLEGMRQKMKMSLMKPFIEGFSVASEKQQPSKVARLTEVSENGTPAKKVKL